MNIIEKYGDKINGVLQTFDRLLITGYILRMFSFNNFTYYLRKNNVLLKDFKGFASKQTDLLCAHIDSYVRENDVKMQYLASGKLSKDEIARQSFVKDISKTGLIAAFSAVEFCTTMTVKPNRETKRLEAGCRNTKCKHYYLYYNDKIFGWMFFKIQTWFPYNVQIYINGREYLSKLMDKNGIEYEMYHNSFAYIDDFEKAQVLADSILGKRLSDSFDSIAKKINILLPDIKKIICAGYYWCVDQCEFATDINFKNRYDLSDIYKTLVETTYFTFSSQDIYSFFGRKIEYIRSFTNGEIVSDLRRRYQGYRVKFKINKNQIKMYDKGNNLRIEVTINNPKDFKVLKTEVVESKGEVCEVKKWAAMGKTIANLYRYVEISKSITNRYINALPEIDGDRLPVKALTDISSRKKNNGVSYSAFNILNPDTLSIFVALSDGAYLINGFDNKMLRRKIFTDADSLRNINKTTRLIAKLKAHGLIKKVHKKNRYYLTVLGRKIIDNILLYMNKTLLNPV